MSTESTFLFFQTQTLLLWISAFPFHFLILSSCILIKMLMNHWFPWVCTHQLALINKMCGVLSAGFLSSWADFCGRTLARGQGWKRAHYSCGVCLACIGLGMGGL